MRVRSSILNLATVALMSATTMAVALPAAPLLIGWLGPSVYGGVRVVNDAMGWLTLLELGLAGAVAPLLARALGRGDERALRETVAAGFRGYSRVVVVALAVGAALTPIIPWFARGLNPAQEADLRRAWLFQLAAFVPMVLMPMRVLVEARQRGYVINLLLTGQSLLITGLSLAFAWAGYGITGQALAQVAGAWVYGLALSALTIGSDPGLLRAALTTPTSPETRRAMRSLSAPSLVINIAGRLSLLSDNLIVGGILDTRRVTSLVNTQKLASMGQTLLLSVGNASWAALAELQAQGRHETFHRRLTEITRLVSVLGAVGFVPVVAYNRAFVRVWLGPGFAYGGDAVVVLAAVNAVLVADQALWCWCFSGAGKIRDMLPVVILQAAVNVVASVVLTYRVGMAGPLMGSAAGLLIGQCLYPLRLRRAFGTPAGPLLAAFGVPFAAGVVAAGALRALTLWHEPDSWAGLAAEMSLSALAMLALSVTTLLTPEERDLWRQRLAALRPARPVAVGPGQGPGGAGP